MLLFKTSYFRLKVFSSNLTCCLHPLMNSFLLFNNRLPLKCSIRYNFSAKHSGPKLISILILLTTSHIMTILCSVLYYSWLKPCFERCFCKTKVYFGTFTCVIFNITSVYQVRHKTLILQRAVFSRSAIATMLGGSRS